MQTRGQARRAAFSLFEEQGGRFFLRPGALNSFRWKCQAEGLPDAAVPDDQYTSEVRKSLDPRQLQDCGYSGEASAIDDAAIAVAVTGGIVTNPAFLDIIDDLLVRAPCLCCYSAQSQARAEEAERQIRILLGYYSQNSYEHSNAFYRLLCGVLRDVTPPEIGMIRVFFENKRHCVVTGAPPAVRRVLAGLNRSPGICAVYTRHANQLPAGEGQPARGILARDGVALCVYSTPEGRQYLRRLRKSCQAAGLNLSTQVAVGGSYRFFCLRFKLRAYAVECFEAAPAVSEEPEETRGDFWKCAAAAIFKQATAKTK